MKSGGRKRITILSSSLVLFLLLASGCGGPPATPLIPTTPSSSTTASPSSTTSSPPPQQILYFTDFTTKDGQWSETSNHDSYTEYREGRFHIGLRQTNLLKWVGPDLWFDNFAVEVNSKVVKGPVANYEFGLLVRAQDLNNYYLFQIAANGQYSLYQKLNGHWLPLKDWAASSAINQGLAENFIKAYCQGDRLTFFVNGTELVNVRNGDFKSGKIALCVGTQEVDNVEVAFDDFKVLAVEGSSSPTPTQLPTRTPTPFSPLLWQDDFSDPSSGWPIMHLDDMALEYKNGQYSISVFKEHWEGSGNSKRTFENFALEVEATPIYGPEEYYYGVIVRQKDTANFYEFALSTAGYYSFHKRLNDEWVVLLDWMECEYMNPGEATNVIKIICQKDTFTLYINDKLMSTIQDQDFSSGNIGLVAGTFEQPDVRVAFDNLTVWSPGLMPTPATSPTLSPTPPTEGNLLYAEDFSDSTGGWPEGSYDDRLYAYKDGAYTITESLANSSAWVTLEDSWGDFALEITAGIAQGPQDATCGVFLRRQDDDNYYGLALTGEGDYNFFLVLLGIHFDLATGFSPYIKEAPSLNFIKVVCQGSTFSIYANGSLVDTVEDDSFATGGGGLFVRTLTEGAATAVFDNLRIWSVP